MSRLRTPLCDLLGIDHPILCAGMGGVAGPDLAAAVTNAGGLGVLGASVTPERIGELSSRTRELTDGPFGANLIIADLEDPSLTDDDRQFIDDQFRAVLSSEASLLVLFWGPVEDFVEQAHEGGVKVVPQVGSVEEAERAAEAGADAVIAQGFESGGHVRGTTSVWELVPQTAAAIAPVPVVAAGGIGDGAGLARAISLGAQGVSLGTRFLASDEGWAHPSYKQRVVDSSSADLFYGELFTIFWPPPSPHRVIRNKVVEEWEAAGRPAEGQRPGEGTSIGTRVMWDGQVAEWPRYATGAAGPDFEGDLDYAPLWAGESVEVVNDIKPARDIVAELVRDAERTLA